MKALVGSWDHRPHQLLAEITSLRARVRELEETLAEVERERDELREALDVARQAPEATGTEHEIVLSG